MKQKLPLIALASAFGFATPSTACAAGGNGDDHKLKLGGIVAEGKAFDAELVAKPDLITVYLNYHSKPMSAKDAEAENHSAKQ